MLTDGQIDQRLAILEGMIAVERDTKTLASLAHTFQRLIDEQVRRDLLKESRHAVRLRILASARAEA